MRDQVLRILRMVQEGRLSPEDAYDLMDAFVSFDERGTETESHEADEKKTTRADDPFRRLLDSVERMTKEATEAVNWAEVADSVRTAAKRGMETLRESVEQMRKGEFGVFWRGPKEEATVELPLHVAAGNMLRLEWMRGDIKVAGGNPVGGLTAKAILRGKTREEAKMKADTWTPILEEHDGSVTIRQSPEAVEEDIQLRVPEGVEVDIRSESGDVRIEDTKASVRVRLESGDLDVRNVQGTIEISVASGDVEVARASGSVEVECRSGDVKLVEVSGNVKVRSSSGGIRIKEAAGRSFAIESVSGDIDIDLNTPLDGTLSVRTVSGDVLLDVPDGCNARVSLSSLSGEVKCALELEDAKRTKERVTGRLGAGEGTLDVSAVSGSVSVAMRDHS